MEVSSCVRGYHVYQYQWTPVINQELSCRREFNNMEDPYAMTIINNDTIVGHVPRKISAIGLMFLRKGGVITCTITGSR